MSKVMDIFVKFWHFYNATPQIWSCHVTQEANFEYTYALSSNVSLVYFNSA